TSGVAWPFLIAAKYDCRELLIRRKQASRFYSSLVAQEILSSASRYAQSRNSLRPTSTPGAHPSRDHVASDGTQRPVRASRTSVLLAQALRYPTRRARRRALSRLRDQFLPLRRVCTQRLQPGGSSSCADGRPGRTPCASRAP